MSVKVLTNLSPYKLPNVYQKFTKTKSSFAKPKLKLKNLLRKKIKVSHSIRGPISTLTKSFNVTASKEDIRLSLNRKIEKLEQCLLKLCGTVELYKDFYHIYKQEGKCPCCSSQSLCLETRLEKKIVRLVDWIKKGYQFKEKAKLTEELKDTVRVRESKSTEFLNDCFNVELLRYGSVLQGKRETYRCLKETVLKKKMCYICDNTVTMKHIPGILSQIDQQLCSLIHS